MKKNILVVAAHPDDELLGSGGAILRHTKGGDNVYCLILGEGIMARTDGTKTELEKLRDDSRRAGGILGFKDMFFSSFPDNSFDTVSLLSIVKEVEKYIAKIRPQVVYTHYEYDLNVDHRLTSEAVLTACRPCSENCPREIYAFETLSSTEWQSKHGKQFVPNVYLDIKATIEDKVRAMKAYKSEIRDYPHPRSVEGIKILAQYRGLESGLEFAEAFCLIRKID